VLKIKPMKRPVYAALDLHSAYSVLGSMDHGGKTRPRTRFATQAELLRKEAARLKERKRPLYLTMEAVWRDFLQSSDCFYCASRLGANPTDLPDLKTTNLRLL
jgi:hypothetical protein